MGVVHPLKSGFFEVNSVRVGYFFQVYVFAVAVAVCEG